MRHRSSRQRHAAILITIVLLLLLLNWLVPYFDAHWWLQPTTQQWQCHTATIRIEHGLSEGFIGYAGHKQGQLWLYSTTVVREVVCRQPTEVDTPELDLQYRDLYLNVTHHDVEGEVQRLQVLYPSSQQYKMWRYQSEELVFQLRPALLHKLDRHSFSTEPLLLDRNDWSHWYFWLCLKLLLLCLVLSLFAIGRWIWQHQQKSTVDQELIDCSQW